jgi:hypothetical protein
MLKSAQPTSSLSPPILNPSTSLPKYSLASLSFLISYIQAYRARRFLNFPQVCIFSATAAENVTA